MTWQLAIGLASGSVISVNFLEVPIAEADVRFGAQSGLKSDYRVLLVFSYVSALGHSRRRRSRRSSANVRTAPRTRPNSRSLGIAANPNDRLRLRGRTSHLDLHRGVKRPPGRPQLRGKRRAELALK